MVRARNYFSNLGAQFRALAGGEVGGYTKLLTDSRNQARERMWREALARGANAIVAMRFDCNEIGDIMSEVAAYGTAVTAEPLGTVQEQAESAP
ncbi:MAG TPA: YbjQ family protein [Streptosporangiaceae bacterium]